MQLSYIHLQFISLLFTFACHSVVVLWSLFSRAYAVKNGFEDAVYA